MDFSGLFDWIWSSLYSIVSSVLGFIISMIFMIINALLLPIDNLIVKNIPVVETLVTHVNNLLYFLIDSINWFFQWFGFSHEIVLVIVTYYTFKVLLPISVHGVKVGIKWYRSLS